MTNKEYREHLLSEIKQLYLSENSKSGQIETDDNSDFILTQEALNYFQDKGYMIVRSTFDCLVYTLTSAGIDFIENDNDRPLVLPVINHGSHNVTIIGDNNTLTGNFASIIEMINDSSDITDEHKELINGFLNEAMTNKKSPTPSRIKDLLVSLTAGTLSGSAVLGLTYLIQFLTSKG